jgi:hypothetical protein
MRFLLKAWLPALATLALISLVYLTTHWSDLSVTHRLSFVLAILLIVHMAEEEHCPGGFGYMYNVVVRRSAHPDRYPMSPVVSMSVNVLMWIFLVTPALFFPHVIWLGLGAMIIGIGELLLHTGVGVGVQQRKHPEMGFYNPGLVTAWFLGATAITYIVIIVADRLLPGWGWLWAVLFFFGNLILFLLTPENVISSPNNKVAYDHDDTFLGYYKRFTTVEDVFGPAERGPSD